MERRRAGCRLAPVRLLSAALWAAACSAPQDSPHDDGVARWRRRLQTLPSGVQGSGSVPDVPDIPDVPSTPNVSTDPLAGAPSASDLASMQANASSLLEGLPSLPSMGNSSLVDNEYSDFGANLASMWGQPENCSVTCLTPVCKANCTKPVQPPLSPTGVLLRLLPMVSATFVTYFGSKVATVVRVGSVFWASAAPSLIPIVQTIQAEGTITPTTFVGIGGAFYAGGLGAFAAVKSKATGIVVQGMAVGYVLSSVLQGFAIGLLLQKYPQAEAYLEWITMAFTFAIGGAVGKFALRYEDIISIAATAIMGAYSQLQIFCSLGFEFTESLSIGAAMNGTFGCTDWPCQLTLGVAIAYALGGVKNQLNQNKLNKIMAENPDFEGEGKIQQTMVKINKAMTIVFTLNEIAGQLSEHHTEEEMKELVQKNMAIVLQLSTVGTNIGKAAQAPRNFCDHKALRVRLSAGLLVLSLSCFSGCIEGFANGAWVLSDGSGTMPYLTRFAATIGLIGILCLLLVIFMIQTLRLPHAEQGKRDTRQKLFLLFAAIIMPIVAVCSLIILVMQEGSPVEVPQIKAAFDADKLPHDQQVALQNHLPTVFGTLQGTLITLAFSWTIICKHLGGIIYLAMKFMSMITMTLFICGAGVAFAGYYGIEHSGLAVDEDVSTLFLILGIIGTFIGGVALLGIIGMQIYYRVRFLGKIILRVYSGLIILMLVLNILLFAVVGYYVTQIDVLIDRDWARLQELVADKREVFANDTRVSSQYYDVGLGNETKAEFVETAKGSFNILMLVGGLLTLLLLTGFVAAHYLVVTDNPIPGKNEKGDKKSDKKDDEEDKKEDKIDIPDVPDMPDGGGGGGDGGEKLSKKEAKAAKKKKKSEERKAKRALR